jgi:hypothetical protein
MIYFFENKDLTVWLTYITAPEIKQKISSKNERLLLWCIVYHSRGGANTRKESGISAEGPRVGCLFLLLNEVVLLRGELYR